MSKISENYTAVKQRIKLASKDANRNSLPKLLAVSKKHGVEKIKQLQQLGQLDFGESYVQEGVDKIQQLEGLPIVWHFIGPIQSNKTKSVAENFAWVQSVDRMKILTRLNKQRPANLSPLNILLQYKVGSEATKSGASEQEILLMIEALADMSRLRFRGLMCIPPPSKDMATQRQYFTEVLQLYQEIKKKNPSVDTLSMGMSGDLESAVLVGSTMVRVGTDLFGQRGA